MFKVLGLFLSFHYLAHGAYYFGVNDRTDWRSAQSRCETGIYVKISGGRLATWDNYDQFNSQVKPAARVNGGESGADAWIGLNDLAGEHYGGSGSEGDWHFVDSRDCGGSCLPKSAVGSQGLDAWSPNEPNDAGDEDCAHVWSIGDRAGNPNGLNDANCGGQRYYVCEFNNINVNTNDPGRYMSDASGPVDIPIQEPSWSNPNKNNYYILEFTSFQDVITIASVILNVIAFALICYLGAKSSTDRSCGYSKVDMYAAEDDKL